MPLIDCAACGRQISTEAASCPQCGHPNRSLPRAPAGHKLAGQRSFSAADVSEADVNQTLAHQMSLCDWVSLAAPDGSYLCATFEPGDLYSLIQGNSRTNESVPAQGKLTREEVREAFLQFLRGDPRWRTSREWAPTPKPPAVPGCGSAVLLVLALGAAVAILAV
jgi:hypothetical protein